MQTRKGVWLSVALATLIASGCTNNGLPDGLIWSSDVDLYLSFYTRYSGVKTLPGGRYEGEFLNGEPHGQGVMTFMDGSHYEGGWRSNRFHGKGVFTFPDGARYEGDFRDDEFHGQGVMTSPDGRSYEGEFRDSEFQGEGIVTVSRGASDGGGLWHGFGSISPREAARGKPHGRGGH